MQLVAFCRDRQVASIHSQPDSLQGGFSCPMSPPATSGPATRPERSDDPSTEPGMGQARRYDSARLAATAESDDHPGDGTATSQQRKAGGRS
jgi:hypothetical protein